MLFQTHNLLKSACLLALASLLTTSAWPAQSPMQGTTPFFLDGNRAYAELDFLRPDGSLHRSLAFVDMGSPDMVLTDYLFKELGASERQPLKFKIGELTVNVPAGQYTHDPSDPYSLGGELKVESVLPAAVLAKYQVVLDYARSTITIAAPGALKPEGVHVPFQINPHTGLIAVQVTIAGSDYPITVDNGSAYTWVSQAAARPWLAQNPDWQRGVGAIGPANMMMSGDSTETSGILLRIPQIAIGGVGLKDIGFFAAGHSKNFPGNLELFDWYSQKNAAPVIGWLGGNILKAFRLALDYPNRMSYWLKQGDPDPGQLTDIGITLEVQHLEFFIAAIAQKDGKPSVAGVQPGDKLVRIADLETKGATWGQIYSALHGAPGERKALVLERDGRRLTVQATTTSF